MELCVERTITNERKRERKRYDIMISGDEDEEVTHQSHRNDRGASAEDVLVSE